MMMMTPTYLHIARILIWKFELLTGLRATDHSEIVVLKLRN